MTDVFPYQRLSLDAGILSHRNRMLIAEGGGMRLMSGDRIRTSLALSVQYSKLLVRQAGGWHLA